MRSLSPACFLLSGLMLLPGIACAEEGLLGHPPRSVVASWPVDALMNTAEEQRILAALGQPMEFIFVNEPLDQVVRELRQQHPTCRLMIDVRALEDMGLSTDQRVTYTDRASATLGQALLLVLEDLDLTLSLRNGWLRITTNEAAEEKLPTRVYDVTAWFSANEAPFNLRETIVLSIDPDTWEELGGPSSMKLQRIGRSRLLVISAPTLVQWKVDALLNCLGNAARLPATSASPRSSDPPPESSIKVYRKSASVLPRFEGSASAR